MKKSFKSVIAVLLTTCMCFTGMGNMGGKVGAATDADNLYGSYGTDIANGKNGYASSNQRQDKNYPVKVGNLTNNSTTGSNYIITHSNDEDPWFCVDLGKSYDINKVTAYQGADNTTYPNAYATDYVIEYSNYTGALGGSTTDENAAYIEDNMNWTTATTVSGAKLGSNTTVFESVNTRYVRIRATGKYSTWVSLYEMYVYETDFSKKYNEQEQPTDDNLKILFIGNSLTEYNDVPNKVKDIFAHEGKTVQCDRLIQLGKSLEYHYSLPETSTTILNGDYDYVVLQDKASNFSGDGLMSGASKIYDNLISKTDAKLIMYMPWANENVLLNTQQVFTDAYLSVAHKYNAPIAPAGEAWFDLYYNYGHHWYSDNIHATNVGSFVSANSIYYAITGYKSQIKYNAKDTIIKNNGYDVNIANLISDKAFYYTKTANTTSNYQSISKNFVVPETTKETPKEQETTVIPEGEKVIGTVVDKSVFLANDNIAIGKKAYASTTTQAAGNAVDKNNGTRWESVSADMQWIYVDLGQEYNIAKVGFNWEGAYAKKYHIQVSNVGGDDDANWTTVKTVTATSAQAVQIDLTNVKARYVRMYGEDRGTVYGFSIYEFGVWEKVNSYGEDGQIKNTELFDIEGFQLKTDVDEDGSASPGYRIIERIGTDKIDGKNIVAHGMMIVPNDYYSKEIMTVDAGDIAGTDLRENKLNENDVLVIKSTVGKIDWSSNGHDDTNASYYSFMMVKNIDSSNVVESLTRVYCVRGFAQLENGDIIYTPVYKASIYNCADTLYKGKQMTNQSAHNYLYDNILSVVTPGYARVEYAWSNVLHKPAGE